MEGWTHLVIYATGLSLLVGSLSEQSEIVDKVWHPIMYLLIPLSGSFFTVESLPKSFAQYVTLNPTVHCTEMIREGFFGESYHWHYDRIYLVTFNVLILAAGILNIRLISKRITLDL